MVKVEWCSWTLCIRCSEMEAPKNMLYVRNAVLNSIIALVRCVVEVTGEEAPISRVAGHSFAVRGLALASPRMKRRAGKALSRADRVLRVLRRSRRRLRSGLAE
jgi:hypothetical protein